MSNRKRNWFMGWACVQTKFHTKLFVRICLEGSKNQELTTNYYDGCIPIKILTVIKLFLLISHDQTKIHNQT